MTRIGYGVDIDDGFQAVVCAKRRWGRTVFESASIAPDTRTGFGRRSHAPVSAALPSGQAVLRRLTAPFPSPAKAARVLPSLLEANLPFSLEQCISLFSGLRRTGASSVSALGAAALRSRIETQRNTLDRVGFSITRLDHEGIALWERSVSESPPLAPDELRAVVYATPARISLALGRGHDLEAAYGASRAPGEAPPGARRAIQAWRGASGSEPVQGFWAGPMAEDNAERALFESAFSQTGPFRFSCHADPASFLARGLAARAIEDPSSGFFLTGALEPPVLRRTAEARLRRAALFLCAAGLLLGGAAGAWRLKIARAEHAVRTEINRWARETIGASDLPEGFEEDRVLRFVRDRKQALEPLNAFFEPSLVHAVSRLVETAYRHEIGIEQVQAGRGTIDIQGGATDWDAPEALADRLRSLGYVPELARQDAGADERIPYTVTGRAP